MARESETDYFCKVEKDINKLFGSNIARIRLLQKISQEELAFRCGLHRTYIGAIERGEKSPTLNTIKRIADGLNIKIIELLDYDS